MPQVSRAALLAIQSRTDESRPASASKSGDTSAQGDFARLMAGRLDEKGSSASASAATEVRQGAADAVASKQSNAHSDQTAASAASSARAALSTEAESADAAAAKTVKGTAAHPEKRSALAQAAKTIQHQSAQIMQAAMQRKQTNGGHDLEALVARLRNLLTGQAGHAGSGSAQAGKSANTPAVDGQVASTLAGASDPAKSLDQLLASLHKMLDKAGKQHDLSAGTRAALQHIEEELQKQMQGLASASHQTGAELADRIAVLTRKLDVLSSLLKQAPALQNSASGQMLGQQLQVQIRQLTQLRQQIVDATKSVSAKAAMSASGKSGHEGPASGLSPDAMVSRMGQTSAHAAHSSGMQAGTNASDATNKSLPGMQALASVAHHVKGSGGHTTGQLMAGLGLLANPGRSADQKPAPANLLTPLTTAGQDSLAAGLSPIYTAAGTSPAAATLTPNGNFNLTNPQLAGNVGQQIQWMVGKNLSSAAIDVTPADLGPLKIRIDLHNNDLKVQLLATHHMTRDVLEQSLPKLREWLQDAGMANAQVSVGADSGDGREPGAFAQLADQGGEGSADGATTGSGGEPLSVDGADAQGVGTMTATTESGPLRRLDLFA